MLTILFIILMIGVFGKLLVLSFKATWGLTKFLFTLVLFPLILIGFVLSGLMSLALPILAIVGIILLVKSYD